MSRSPMRTSWWFVAKRRAIVARGVELVVARRDLCKPTVKVSTGRDICSAISATFAEESTPPERKTPNGTSDIMRFRIESRSSRRISARCSPSLVARAPPFARASGGSASQYRIVRAVPSRSQTSMWPAGILFIPLKSVEGAGVVRKER